MQAGAHSQGDCRAVRRFGEIAVDVIPEDVLQSEGHPAGAASHTAGQVHHQRVLPIHGDSQSPQLAFEPPCRHRISGKERQRVLVVDKVHGGIGGGFGPPGVHGLAEIPLVFHHGDPVGTQQLLLPVPGVGGHVHRGAKAQSCSGDADGQAEVAGGTHHDAVPSQDGLDVLVRETRVVVIG